jgi:hypothetical protein
MRKVPAIPHTSFAEPKRALGVNLLAEVPLPDQEPLLTNVLVKGIAALGVTLFDAAV